MKKGKIHSCVLTRVSTKMEVQLSSLQFQNDTLIEYVKKQKDEIFDENLDVFSDQVTGTKIYKGNKNDQGFDTLMRLLNISISDYDTQDFTKVSIEFDKTKDDNNNSKDNTNNSTIDEQDNLMQYTIEYINEQHLREIISEREKYFQPLNSGMIHFRELKGKDEKKKMKELSLYTKKTKVQVQQEMTV